MNMNRREDARILFAGMAMQGLASRHADRLPIKQAAHEAVMYADALIAELERTEKGG